MKLLSTDPSEPGIIGVGQEAYGVIAFGQIATGVVAIGQGARGVIAIGQLAIGLVAIGQLAFGLYAGVAMLGLFGRGFPLSLIPKLPRPRQLPPTTDLSQVRMGYGDGWVEAELGLSPGGVPVLQHEGVTVEEIKLAASWVPRARAELGRYQTPKVIAHVRRIGQTLVCDRLLHVPVPLSETKGFRQLTTLRMVVLVGLALACWVVLWPPLASLF